MRCIVSHGWCPRPDLSSQHRARGGKMECTNTWRSEVRDLHGGWRARLALWLAEAMQNGGCWALPRTQKLSDARLWNREEDWGARSAGENGWALRKTALRIGNTSRHPLRRHSEVHHACTHCGATCEDVEGESLEERRQAKEGEERVRKTADRIIDDKL